MHTHWKQAKSDTIAVSFPTCINAGLIAFELLATFFERIEMYIAKLFRHQATGVGRVYKERR